MNFGKAFTYIFDDTRWFDKLIIPLLVGLIPFVGQMAQMGYLLRTLKNVADHQEYPLPDFSFGVDLGKGFRFFLITFLYFLPFMILSLLILFPARMMEGNQNNVLGGVLLFLIMAFLILAGILVSLVIPLSMANFAVKDTFTSAFNFKDFAGMLKNNIIPWLLVLVGLVISSIISPLGGIVLVIGALITGFYSQLMVAHLSGQAYALSQSPTGTVVSPH